MARLAAVAPALLAVSLAAVAEAQVARVVVGTGDPVPGEPGVTILGIQDAWTTPVGGYYAMVSCSDTRGRLVGSPTGGPPEVLRAIEPIGGLNQLAYPFTTSTRPWAGDSFGRFLYLAQYVVPPSEDVELAAWLEREIFIDEGLPVLSQPGYEWTSVGGGFGFLADGTPWWSARSASNDVPLRFGLYVGEEQTPLYLTGDVVPDLPGPIHTTTDFRGASLSPRGLHHVVPVDVPGADGETVIADGRGLKVAGALLIEGAAVPASSGGLPGETWRTFDRGNVNDAGDYALRAFTTEGMTLLSNGAIVARQGSTVDGQPIGIIGQVDLNQAGDVLFVAQLGSGVFDPPGLFVNGQLVLTEGDPIDLDGDGAADPGVTLSHFSDYEAAKLSERDLAGRVDVYLVARADFLGTPTIFDDVIAVLSLPVQAGPGMVVAPIDVDPASCANGLDGLPAAKGVRVAILGTSELDVRDIDPTTLRLARQDGLGVELSALGGRMPVVDLLGPPAEPHGCTQPGPDGFEDLVVGFATDGVLQGLRLRDVPTGAEVPLVLTGELADRTPFGGRDVVHLALGILDPNPGLAKE